MPGEGTRTSKGSESAQPCYSHPSPIRLVSRIAEMEMVSKKQNNEASGPITPEPETSLPRDERRAKMMHKLVREDV